MVRIVIILVIVFLSYLIFPIELLKKSKGIVSNVEYVEKTNKYNAKIAFKTYTHGGLMFNRTFKIDICLNVGDTVVFDSYGIINVGKIKEVKLNRHGRRYFVFDLHGDDFEVLDQNISKKMKPGDDLYLRVFNSDIIENKQEENKQENKQENKHNNFVE